jgi:hypothetical protein
MFTMIDGEGIMPSAQAFWLTDTRKRVIPFHFIGTIRHCTCVKYGSSYVLERTGEIRLGVVELCTFRSVHGQAASVLHVVHTDCIWHEDHWSWSGTHTKNMACPYIPMLSFVSPVVPFLYGSEINVGVQIMGRKQSDLHYLPLPCNVE